MRDQKATILPVLFFLILLFPLINKFIHVLPLLPNNENRLLAVFPVLNINKLDEYPGKFENYYNDNISIRNNLLRMYNYISYFILKKSSFSSTVITGNNGWLFRSEDEQDVYEGKGMFTGDELKKFAIILSEREKYLDSIHCKFYFVIAPVKQSVYFDELPDYLQIKNPFTRTDQLLKYLEQHTDIKVIDLRKALIEKKGNMKLYCKNDNHWNDIGAYYASSAIANRMKEDFPDLKINPMVNYQLGNRTVTGGNLAELLGLGTYFKDIDIRMNPQRSEVFDGSGRKYKPDKDFPYPWEYCVVKTTYDHTKPKLLIIRDSFGNKVIPFLSVGFSETVSIWDNWEYQLNKNIVIDEKPDAFILMVLESHLDAVLKHPDDK
ncbi:MAG: hypothetical protein NTW49_05575 [Bacteroidia bacterium]|nr:hypothetical protein [Bacteroidia bacterium]